MSALSWLLSHGVGDNPKVLLGGLAEAVRSDSDEAFDRLRDLVGPKPITPEPRRICSVKPPRTAMFEWSHIFSNSILA
jgi:hypothetical protein